MPWYSDDDPKAAAQAVADEIERRRKRGEPFEPTVCETRRGSTSTTFWGQAWCDNLEAYSDMEHRLPRGRTYLRKGHVYDLTIDPGEVFAYVTGASIYEVLIKIAPLDPETWERVKVDCGGQIDSLLDLLGGKIGPSVMTRITDPDNGLFPSPDKILLSCDCPDYADVCKHIAAVIYAIGVNLDHDPTLLFKLRQIDHTELIDQAAEKAGLAAEEAIAPTDNILAPNQLSELFGIEITDPESAFF